MNTFRPTHDQRSGMAAGRQPARPNFEFRISNFEFRISRASPRRGVSLLEVLISMFVMLFGLMGVAAIFPVGNHYAVRGERFDRGAAAIDVAVADLKARGVLDTRAWLYADANNTPLMNYDGVFNPSTRRIRGPAFLIDPLGASMVDPGQGLPMFPYGGDGGSVNPWGLLDETGDPLGWPIRRVSLRQRGQDFRLSTIAAELIATLRDDVTVDVPRDADRPSVVRWNIVNGVPGSRQSRGAYSWIALVQPTMGDANGLAAMQPAHPGYGTTPYEVSVAVINRRETATLDASEWALEAKLLPGGELVLYASTDRDGLDRADLVDRALQGIRVGQWIALAGVHTVSTNPPNAQFLVRWYRLLSLDDETTIPDNAPPWRGAMVAGPDWPISAARPNQASNLRAILTPGVVAVTTRTMTLEDGFGGANY